MVNIIQKPKSDLIFLHAPSVYDFRKRSILFGPISDLVPSGPIFEMYPIGLTTIQEYLNRYGYNVRIINIALKMLKNDKFNVQALIKNLHTKAFGIDLHWLAHAHGSIEIAKIIKKFHPKTPVIFGGLSASYYHKELIKYPQVDYVIRGDSTEEPLRLLLNKITKGCLPDNVPNVTWKNGKIYTNPLTHVPKNIDNLCADYSHVFKSVIKYRDLTGHLPLTNWMEYPITAAMTCRGCTQQCVICGGSAYSFKNHFNRKKTVFRSPELIYEDIKSISNISRGPIFIIGDLRHAGTTYANHLLKLCKPLKLKNQIAIELFTPADNRYFKKINKAFSHYSVEMSMDSHDEIVRKASGKSYTNKDVYKTIEAALNNNCERFDLFFLIGLPKQTKENAIELIKWCDNLYKRFNYDKRILVFTSPLGPFLDPASLAFEKPEQHGYKIFYKTLEEHRQALLQPSWKYTLNYETKWITRDEIVEATYESGLGLNNLKRKYNIISKEIADNTEKRINMAIDLMKKIDNMMLIKNPVKKEKALESIKKWVANCSVSTVCETKELEWPLKRAYSFKITGIIRNMLSPSKKVRVLK